MPRLARPSVKFWLWRLRVCIDTSAGWAVAQVLVMTPEYLEKASLYSAGTEATERALKLARYHGMQFNPRRSVIVGWDGNYHGKTMGAQMASGQRGERNSML